MKIYEEIQEHLNRGTSSVLYTRWEKGVGGGLSCLTQEVRVWPPEEEEGALEKQMKERGMPALKEENGQFTLAEPYYPEDRLIVLGGGHVALPLTEFAARCGFAVTVVDDRPFFCNRERFPRAFRTLCDEFRHAIRSLNIRPEDYVCLLTRGHRYDSECLREVLSGEEPGYLGMIGSRRRVAIVKEQLVEEGYSREALERLHSPIGLEIGGITPEEIAISIVAELIQTKRLGRGNGIVRNQSDLDYRVVEMLAEEKRPGALLTVVSSQGSVPRGAGAKMIVYPDGTTLGSIGGGCSEAEAMRVGRRLIGSGGCRLEHIDLTGDAAEEEGMVCGGVMDVLIQDIR